ncbi:MAG: polysaccharide biosynthesis C-terminal domain-containing protein [Candidatus Methanoperedens sp.]|nr:polysaccharide biosynthesis C-terminal domain-containing protein [Candidatus Methanoperedens sp.]MCZ7370639.1 polysaccharide biosynthesis C-terminal domain-containing protein [Candidatus Methanoperedens sp.]
MANPSKDTLLMLIVFAIGAFLNYTYNIVMGWLLTPQQYGILGVAISFLTILSLFVSSAFPLAVAKFLSEGIGDDVKHRVFKSSLVGNLGIALPVSFLFYGLYASGLIRLDSTYRPFVLFIIIALIISAVGGVYTSALQGMFRFKKFGLVSITTVATKLVFAVLLVLLGYGAFGAFSGLIASTAAGLLLSLIFTRDFKFWKTGGWESRRIYSFAFPLFVGTFFMTLLMNLDILGVKFLSEKVLSDTLTGYYRSALILAELPVFAAGALMGAMFPYISRYSSTNSNYSNKTLKYTVLMICPVCIALFVIPSSMISLVFPPTYAAASGALGILAVGMAFFTVITALVGIFQAMHRPRVPAIILMLSIAVDVIALFFLVPRYGIIGAAASTTIACAAGLLGLTGVYLKCGFLEFELTKTLKILLAFILFGAIIFMFPSGTKLLTFLDLLAGFAAYTVILFSFRLLDGEDVRMFLAGFGKSEILEKIMKDVESLKWLFKG